MPNWCSNRMYFSGEPAQIAEIKRLASGAVTPFYRRATNEGIQLFLAGSAGLLQTTEDVQFEPCPGLTADPALPDARCAVVASHRISP